MAKKRLVLTFPPEVVERPVVSLMVKEYDVITNILRAEIHEGEIGRMLVELHIMRGVHRRVPAPRAQSPGARLGARARQGPLHPVRVLRRCLPTTAHQGEVLAKTQ